MQLAGLGLGHVAHHQQRIQFDHRAARLAGAEIGAGFRVAVVEHAGERRLDVHLLQRDLGLPPAPLPPRRKKVSMKAKR